MHFAADNTASSSDRVLASTSTSTSTSTSAVAGDALAAAEPALPCVDTMLDALRTVLPLRRRELQPGEALYGRLERFNELSLPTWGCLKTVARSREGVQHIVGLHLRGDWLDLEALASGFHAVEAIAVDSAELQCIARADLLIACRRNVALLGLLQRSLSAAIGRQQRLQAVPRGRHADERLACFFQWWRGSMTERGMAGSLIPLPLPLSDVAGFIGDSLGQVESVLERLMRRRIVRLIEGPARALEILDERRWAAYLADPTAGDASIRAHRQ